MNWPAPHGDKLRSLLRNDKLPAGDRARVRAAIRHYEAWIGELEQVTGARDDIVHAMVAALNCYKTFIDLELVFDSPEDFLYRQKGQLKLDNTVVEEFIPWLVRHVFHDGLADRAVVLGPTTTCAQLHFDSDLTGLTVDGGMAVQSKNQDGAMAPSWF